MIRFFLEMMSEKSKVSLTRFVTLLCVLTAIFIAIYGTLHSMDLSSLSVLCGVFLGAAFGGKVSQKFAENKSEKE